MIFTIASVLMLAQPSSCSPPAGSGQLWADPETRFVVVGERHGTVEAPATFADMVCAASTDRPVTVGVEFEDSVQPELDRWMASDGGPTARREFLTHITWTRRFQDGRSSLAMLDMLERLRTLKAEGRDLAVVAFVGGYRWESELGQKYYELAMAQGLSLMAQARPDALNMVLVGRFHASKASDGDIRPAVAHLPNADVVSLSMIEQGGQAWFCPNEDAPPGQPPESVCRASPIKGTDDGARGVILDGLDDDGFDGYLAIGPTTASPPAVSR